MGQVLAVFWEKRVLLNETGTAKERARAHTMQRRGCCMRVVRMERGECEEERIPCRVPGSECNPRSWDTPASRAGEEPDGDWNCLPERGPERRRLAVANGRSGSGALTAAPGPHGDGPVSRRGRRGARKRRGLEPWAEGCAGSCRQEASRDWASPSEGSAAAQHLAVLQVVLRSSRRVACASRALFFSLGTHCLSLPFLLSALSCAVPETKALSCAALYCLHLTGLTSTVCLPSAPLPQSISSSDLSMESFLVGSPSCQPVVRLAVLSFADTWMSFSPSVHFKFS